MNVGLGRRERMIRPNCPRGSRFLGSSSHVRFPVGGGMDRIFRVGGDGGRPATDAYVDRCAVPLVPLTSQLIALVRAAAPGAREVMHDGHPTFCVDDAPFVYVAAFTSHTNLGFFDGVALDDPGAVLEGKG
jgi:hypothetical protein